MKQNYKLTEMTESRAERVKISAQETTPGQTFSTFFFILSITLKPRTDLLLGAAVCSPVNVGVSSRRIDPSQPYNIIIFTQYN